MSPDSTQATEPAAPLSVAELTATINDRLSELGRLAVVGEVTSVTKATSGHIYFKLKDRLRGTESVVSAVVWRSAARERLKAMLVEGAELVCHGRLDVYAPRGTYSLIVDRVELRGVGALMQRFEELKQKLKEDGWFERSRELPPWPRPVGVVTSRDTAALQDFLRTRDLRWPDYPVRLAHAPVQGPGASAALADQIKALDASGVDLIVVTRGGGSLEDLWAFNELPVLEAIRGASVPVVSGVGHETDTTLTDFVADHRCHTPTDAAQLVIPDRAALIARLERSLGNLGRAIDHHFARRAERLASISRRPVLRRAERLLEPARERLERAGQDLLEAAQGELEERRARLAMSAVELRARSPRARMEQARVQLGELGRDLFGQARARLSARRSRLDLAQRSLETTSPFAVLERGYSITRDASGRAIRSACELSEGAELETVLSSGRVGSTVTRVERAEEEA
jgi:exodeoxyribonuclease VII large subunit